MKFCEALKDAGIRPSFQRTLTVMQYELGDLAKCVIYGRLDSTTAPDLAYRAEARVALADALVQLAILAEMLDVSTATSMSEGIERFEEHMAEVKAGVI